MKNFRANLKPEEKGNAENIKEVCCPTLPLILVRYESISEYYSQEPLLINIRPTELDDFITFEQVLRLRIWVPNEKINSWCIYSKEREWEVTRKLAKGIIIRHVVWDRKNDMAKAKENIENRQSLLNNWPTIKINNFYITPEISLELANDLKELDKFLVKGIKLRRRKSGEDKPEWGDFEILRLFDWGQVHATWGPTISNSNIEDYVKNLDKKLELYLSASHVTIYQMDLDYSYPTEIHKAIIQGDYIATNPKQN